MSKTILVIEDNIETRELYELALSDYGVKAFANAAEAFTYLESHPAPDLIICDLMMPGMDGDQFIVMLRKDPRWASVSVVIVSGVDNLKKRAAEMKATGFLRKPFDLETLEKTVKEHLKE